MEVHYVYNNNNRRLVTITYGDVLYLNEGIHLDLDTWIVPGQIRNLNLNFKNGCHSSNSPLIRVHPRVKNNIK